MTHPRISLALDAFDPLPAGQILVLGARETDDLSDLPRAQLTLIQGFAPDHAALNMRGFDVHPSLDALDPAGTFGSALIFLPRSKTQARAMIAEARARTQGPIWIDGAKTDGIDSILKDMRSVGETAPPVSKAHGKIFAARPSSDLAQWLPAETSPAEGFVTRPGVFSEGKVDRGSQLLAAVLPPTPVACRRSGRGLGGLAFGTDSGRARRRGAASDRGGSHRVGLCASQHHRSACAVPLGRCDNDQFRSSLWRGGDEPAVPHDARCRSGLGRCVHPRGGEAPFSVGQPLYGRQSPSAYETVLRSQFKEVEELFAPQASGARGPDGAFKLFRAAKPVIGR